MNEILVVDNITKTYGKKSEKQYQALKGINFKVISGEFVAIMGASGSGKTTLLNILSTLDKPTTGQVFINGKDISNLNTNQMADFRSKEIGFIFQDFNLLENLTNRENIALPLSLRGISTNRINPLVDKIAAKLGIKEILDKYGYKFFELLDECYKNIYGTIPFNKKLVDQTIASFRIIIDKKYVSLIFNKEDELIGFGVGFPSLADAMIKCRGRYLPTGIFHLLKAIKHPKVLELGLIAVKPEYQKKGVTSVIIHSILSRMIENNIEYCDTGCQLEDNLPAIAALDMFEREAIRRRVCYIKQL